MPVGNLPIAPVNQFFLEASLFLKWFTTLGTDKFSKSHFHNFFYSIPAEMLRASASSDWANSSINEYKSSKMVGDTSSHRFLYALIKVSLGLLLNKNLK